MRIRSATLGLLLASTSCAALRGAPPPPPPLGGGAEVQVFLQRLPREVERLSFVVAGVSLRREDGAEVPLTLETPEIDGARADQRRLAWGRVPPGEYAGLAVRISSAALAQGKERARLLGDAEPIREDLHLHLAPGRAAVVWLELGPAPVTAEFAFAPRFTALLASRTAPRAALYCTNEGEASVTAADRVARAVTDVLPVPGTPRGVVLDPLATRAYVALHREDRLEVLDLAAGVSVAEIRLLPGDGPGDVGMGADGTLVVVNVRSRTVAFVDPGTFAELSRVPVGDDPYSILVDRQGRRAYVANRGSSTVTVIDIGNRAVVATISTDPEPLRTALSWDGTLLYVVHRGSHYVAAFTIPTFAPAARTFVGIGGVALKVDPRSGLIYLARGEERRIAVLDPLSLQQIDVIEAPGAVSVMTIDDAENTLLALLPERRTILVVDLTSRRRLAEIPVGAAPYAFAFSGERP